MPDYDVVIIGTSNQALALAAYLGKDLDLKCLLLDRRKTIGAAAMTREIYPGYRGHVAATGYANYVTGPIVEDLELLKRGVEMIKLDPWLTVLFRDGHYARIWEDFDKTYNEIAVNFSQADADGYKGFVDRWATMAELMGSGLSGAPVRFVELVEGMSATPEFEEMMRDMLFMSLQRGMDQTFKDKHLADMFNVWLEGVYSPPSAPGTMFGIVGHLLMNEQWAVNKGGLGVMAKAFADAAVEYGAEIRTGAEVVEILTKNNKAYGVRLTSGEEITGSVVVSNAEVAATVDLVGEQNFDPDYVRKARSGWFEAAGNTISFALKGKPHFTGMPDESLKGFIGFNAERELAEKAYCEAHTGRIPEDPLMIGYLISEIDKGTYAPEGGALMTVYAFPNVWDFADGSTWDDPKNKKQFYDNLVNSLTKYAPDFKDLLLAVDGFTPGELFKEFGMTRGDHQHGVTEWGYMLGFRPVIGEEPYTSPIDNLFLVGAPHQPTGISGYIGQNVARLIEPQWDNLK